MYEEWLIYIIIWTCPWITIVLADYFVRGANYNTAELMNWGQGEYWYKSGVFWPALVSFIAGMGVSMIFTNSALYASPLMINTFGGADLSYFAGIQVTLAIYYFWAKNDPTYARARAMSKSIYSDD